MSNGRFDYTILYNGTLRPSYDMTDEPVVPALAHRLASMLYMNSHHLSELYLYSMDFPEAPNTYMLDPTLFWGLPAVLGFLQVVITFQMVAEKATNMRELMVMAGLKRGPYWIISWGYGYLLYLGEVMLFLIVAYAFEFRAIANHDFAFVLSPAAALVHADHVVCHVHEHHLRQQVGGARGQLLPAHHHTGASSDGSLPIAHCRLSRRLKLARSLSVNLLPVFALAHASQLLHDAGIGTFQQLSGVRLGFENIGWDEAHPIGAIMVSMLIGAILWMALAIYWT